jgi:uncharacterized protein
MKFDVQQLSEALESACPQADFALLHGSAKDGELKKGSDIDVALFLNCKPSTEIYMSAIKAVHEVCPDAEADIGILNNAEPVYRFEALKGKLLFNRNMEKYLDFFSLTCREYESQMYDYQRQHRYRMEVRSSKK